MFGNSGLQHTNNDQVGWLRTWQLDMPDVVKPVSQSASLVYLGVSCCRCSSNAADKGALAGGMDVWRKLQRRAAQSQLGVLHLHPAFAPGSTRNTPEPRTLNVHAPGPFPTLPAPITTSEPLLTLRGAASCVSSQCRDFQAFPSLVEPTLLLLYIYLTIAKFVRSGSIWTSPPSNRRQH